MCYGRVKPKPLYCATKAGKAMHGVMEGSHLICSSDSCWISQTIDSAHHTPGGVPASRAGGPELGRREPRHLQCLAGGIHAWTIHADTLATERDAFAQEMGL